MESLIVRRTRNNAAPVPTETVEGTMDKTPLSAVLITLNAASQLRTTLESLRFCDELVIVDSGSTDDTLRIAHEFQARVFHQDWSGFGPQKQYAVAQAKHDWVLCLDADEEVSPELRLSIETKIQDRTAIQTQPTGGVPAGYAMARCNYFLGRYLRHGEGYPDWSLRLFNRQHANWNSEAVHEAVVGLHPNTHFGRLQGDLLHHSAESLGQYLNKQNRYTDIQASTLAERKAWPSTAKLVLSPLVRFIKFYLLRKGFLDGWAGFVHISIGCFNSFIKYAKTREKMGKKKG